MNFPSRDELNNKLRQQLEEIEKNNKGPIPKISDSDEDFNRDVQINTSEESKSYSWSRLYTSEKYDLEPGDVITITYLPSGETLDVTFATYDKKGLNKDFDGMIDYNPTEDKKVLCLMVDINQINNDPQIPFLKTLFRSSKFYEHQLLKRNDLKFECKEKKLELEYYSVDFK